MRKIYIAAALVLLLMSAAYAADVELKDFYGPREILSGTIFLKLTNVSADSNFSVKVDNAIIGRIKIIDLLKNASVSYSCVPSNCSSTFSASSPSATKSVANDYIALNVSGKDVTINEIKFNISGNYVERSCGEAPVKIDILDDGTIDWQYMEPDTSADPYCWILTSNPNYNLSAAGEISEVLTNNYCEIIELIPAKKFRIGADIVVGTVPVNLSMFISDGSTNSDECQLAFETGQKTCDVNFTVAEKGNYYVCIHSDSDESDTMIKGETQKPTCGQKGLAGFDCDSSSVDYAIYAQPTYFKPFTEKIEFNNSVFQDFSSDELKSYVQSYLNDKYNADCSAGCAIPIKVISSQSTVFSDLSLRYSTNITDKTERKFYSAAKKAAKISVNQTIRLESAGFILPSKYGDLEIIFMINTTEIEEQIITIAQIPVINYISPLIVAAATSTEFAASATSLKGNVLTSYEWDFGDGGTDETAVPYVMHTYSTAGKYNLTLKITDEDGFYNQGTFEITAEEPKISVNLTLQTKKANLASLKLEMAKIPGWYGSLVSDVINLTSIEAEIANFEAELKKPAPDYVTLKPALDSLFVPSAIIEEGFETTMHSEPDAKYVAKIEGSELADEENMNERIKAWNNANIDITAFYTTKTAVEGTKQELLATEYKLEISSKGGNSFDDIYIIIVPPSDEIMFKSGYSEYEKREVDGAAGFVMAVDSEPKEIDFAIKGNHPADEFAIFASPGLEMLNVEEGVVCGDDLCEKERGESYTVCPADCPKPYGIAVLWAVLIIAAVGLGIFVIWKYYAALYDRRLRERIFKPIEDFYKISFFIANEMNKGKKEKEILDELEKAGWKNSQIDYAMQKVREQTRAMQKKSILSYVINELRKGEKEEDIAKRLEESGWKHKIIRWAFKKARKVFKS